MTGYVALGSPTNLSVQGYLEDRTLNPSRQANPVVFDAVAVGDVVLSP